MVVAKREVREVAMKIENDIAINIHKEVALALLCINKPMNLKHFIFHLIYLPGKPGPSCTTESHLRSADAWAQGKLQPP